MQKGYWVVAYRSISDESALKAYGALAVPAVQSFGGRFLDERLFALFRLSLNAVNVSCGPSVCE
jgi:hypothetical protein